MALPLVSDSVNIVIKGPFNPAIFSPAWLLANGVIGVKEHTDAKIEFISTDIARFDCSWLEVTVTRDALQYATSVVEEFERLRDAAVVTLDLLPHVPIAVMGINRSANFEAGGTEQWHKIGDRLAPKEVWEGALDLPGMKSLTIWGVRNDDQAGRIHVTVEPSTVLPTGILVTHNDHFELSKVQHQPETREEFGALQSVSVEPDLHKSALARVLLVEAWEDSLRRASNIMESVYRAGQD